MVDQLWLRVSAKKESQRHGQLGGHAEGEKAKVARVHLLRLGQRGLDAQVRGYHLPQWREFAAQNKPPTNGLATEQKLHKI